jgi:dienelactone hydrolase
MPRSGRSKGPRFPTSIPDRLPETGALAPADDRRDDQYRELLGWWSRRTEGARAAETGQSGGSQLLEVLGVLGAPELGEPRWRNGRRTGIGDRASSVRRVTVSYGPAAEWRVSALVLGDPRAARMRRVVIVAVDRDPAADEWTAIDRTAGDELAVIVLGLVRRVRRGGVCRTVKKDRRHLLHRLAFPVGHTLTGLDAAAIAAVARAVGDRDVSIVGDARSERAVLAASLLLDRLPGVVIAGDDQDDSAEAPDRWIHRWLPVGGDDALREAAGDHASGGIRRADSIMAALGAAPGSPGPRRTDLDAMLKRASDRTFQAWHDALRSRVSGAATRRANRWHLHDASEDERAARAARIRDEVSATLGGESGAIVTRAASRLLRVEAGFVAYELVLEVDAGLTAWLHVLIPRSGNAPWPVVIAQHGLDGGPGDVTGLDARDERSYHAFGARLADRGYVVVAPYLTVPSPQEELLNPIVAMATALGEERSSAERIKLVALVDWLNGQPWVDIGRLGYYGLSYGGHAALWLAGLDSRFRAVVVSGHFNDWTAKTTGVDPASFLAHPDEDFTTWRGLERFTHLELLAAAWPRPTLIEAGSTDPISNGAWFGRARAEAEDLARAWEWTSLEFETFDGIHEVAGAASFEFLDRWLKPHEVPSRTYEYDLRTGRRDLPGIGDGGTATLPYRETRIPGGGQSTFPIRFGPRPQRVARLAIRGWREGDVERVDVQLGTAPGLADLGCAQLDGDAIQPLWDLWNEAGLANPFETGPNATVHVTLEPAGPPSSALVVVGPRSLAPDDARVRPAFRLPNGAVTDDSIEVTHEFARAALARVRPAPGVDSTASPDERVLRLASTWAGEARYPKLELRVDQTVADGLGPESHRIEWDGDLVRLVGASARGVLRSAARFVERAEPGIWHETVRHRVTTAVMPAGTRYSEASLPGVYTDGLLERISRAGFNGIWTWLNLEEATVDSAVFPELDDPDTPERLAHLQALTERAAGFGLDVYVYLAANYHRPIPESFFRRHPELRGAGWLAPTLCSSDSRVLAYHREVVDGILRSSPGIAGFVAIFDIEGFYFCGSEEETRLACPRCRYRSPEDLAVEVLANVADVVRAHGPRRELIAWSYGPHPDWVERVIERLPPDVAIQADFTKGVPVTRDGITEPAGDYTLAEVGPAPNYTRFRETARRVGRQFWAKTEHAISLDAVFVPYLPVLDQLADRAAAVRATEPVGWFANWEHYGFLELLPAQLLNSFAFDPLPAREALLDGLAEQRFGAAAVTDARRAWHAFSRGIRAFPYSDPVARQPGPLQKGPTQPLWLDPGLQPSGSWRSWQNDLDWTRPWGPELARAALDATAGAFADGIDAFERVVAATQPGTVERAMAEADVRLAQVLETSLRCTIALIDWIQARDALEATSDPDARAERLGRLRAIALEERERCAAILPVLERDSRLGFAQDGGGVVRGGLFTPDLLRWKLGLLDDLLVRQLPGIGALATLVPLTV